MLSIVETSKGYVKVTTNKLHNENTFETMVFPCDSEGNIKNFLEMDVKRYNNRRAANIGHRVIVKKWEVR